MKFVQPHLRTCWLVFMHAVSNEDSNFSLGFKLRVLFTSPICITRKCVLVIKTDIFRHLYTSSIGVILLIQGYSSLDRKGTLFDDWDLKEVGVSEMSEVCSFFLLFLDFYMFIIP